VSSVVSGRLEEIGLEEIEPGIVEDSSENRRTLANQDPRWTWERVRDEEGVPCGLLQPISPEALTLTRRSVHDRRRPLLTDSENPWSDYVHPDDYPLDVDMPWWVEMRLRTWREQATEGVPELERRPFPTRCTQLRTDNTRCWNWVGHPAKLTVCKSHTDLTREAVTKTPAYARERVLELSIDAVDTLAYLMNFADGEAVRLKASTEVLDRAGVRGGTEIDMNVSVAQADPGEQLQQKLDALKKRHEAVVIEEPELDRPALLPAEEPVDAEIVDEETEVV
jgi:hypothetical protein